VRAALQALLGDEQGLRLRMTRTLIAAAFAALIATLDWILVRLGRVDAGAAAGLTALLVVGVACFVVLIRRNLTVRFADPGLSMAQMIFALVVLAVAYRIDGGLRGALLALAALVVGSSAFVLTPRRCRQLGWIALDVLGIAMALEAWRTDTIGRELESLHFVIALVVFPSLGSFAVRLSGLRMEQERNRGALRDAVERLEGLALRDDMTGLPNRRHVQEWVVHERARNRRSGTSLCVAIVDLDHFKRINDTLGHAVGDEVLRIFARTALMSLRDCDVIARWGGEEFLIVMPDTSLVAGRLAIERLRERLANTATWTTLPGGQVTFSAGLTTMESDQTLEETVERADGALYDAKRAGRDRIVVAFPTTRAT
jgi:diguanylate cyclase